MAEVRISGLHKYYGPVHALKGLDLTVADGEFAVFVGPSGCGKSTLLRTIAGLEEQDGGEIRIGGQVVNDMRPRDRNIAMVFQNYALYPYLTVYDNIAFGLRARKVGAAEIRKRVDDAPEFAFHPPSFVTVAGIRGCATRRAKVYETLVSVRGKAAALNYAVERLDEEFYVGIDADTVIAPDAIAKLIPQADIHLFANCGHNLPREMAADYLGAAIKLFAP